jgi:VCBS repeat-containing protein
LGDYGYTIDPYATMTLDQGRYYLVVRGEVATEGEYSLHITRSDRDVAFHYVDQDTPVAIAATELLANDSDPEGDTITIFTVQGTSALGAAVTLGPDGEVTYDARGSATLAALVSGETAEDSFSYTITDGRGQQATATVSLVVDGVDDAAVIGGESTGAVTEDTAVTLGLLATGGALTIADPDAGEAAFRAKASVNGTYGTFSLAGDGTWAYAASNASAIVQGIAGGQQVTDTMTAVSKDGSASKQIIVTLNGANDSATISGQTTGMVWRDVGVDASGDITATGDLDVSDPDTGESVFAAESVIAGTYGSFSINADGDWSYHASNANAAIQGLAYGETLTDSATVVSIDGTASAVLSVDILTTFPALIGGTRTGSLLRNNDVDSSGYLNASGSLTITDTDPGEAAFVAQTDTIGSYGAFSLVSNGTWSYFADNTQAAVQDLDQGETLTDSFTVFSIDGSEQTVTITLNSNVIKGSNGQNTLNGTNANDEMFGLANDDTLNGGDGNDVLDGGGGRDTLRGQGGDDLLIADSSDGIVNGGDGIDTASFEGVNVGLRLNIRTEEAVVIGQSTAFGRLQEIENLIGGTGGDTLIGDSGANRLEGGAGDDTLSGLSGEDIIVGGDGDDRIGGGANIDWLTGGAGADSFVFLSGMGQDRITDFDRSEDKLDFSVYGAWADHTEFMADDTVIVFENAIGPGFGIIGTGFFLFQDAEFNATNIWDHLTPDVFVF